MNRLLNRFQWPTWLFAGLIVTAITGQNACAAVIQFSFTAADFYGSTGSGTFSYDADSYGYPVSATHKNYGPSGFFVGDSMRENTSSPRRLTPCLTRNSTSKSSASQLLGG